MESGHNGALVCRICFRTLIGAESAQFRVDGFLAVCHVYIDRLRS